jgi:hypothetical protein
MSSKYLVHYHSYPIVRGDCVQNLKPLCELTTGVVGDEGDMFGQCVLCYRNSHGNGPVEWRKVVDGSSNEYRMH